MSQSILLGLDDDGHSYLSSTKMANVGTRNENVPPWTKIFYETVFYLNVFPLLLGQGDDGHSHLSINRRANVGTRNENVPP